MKKNGLIIATVLTGLLLNGCSNKEPKVEKHQVENVKNKLSLSTKNLKDSNSNDDTIKVEILPSSDKKLKVVTKVKPEVAIVSTEKLDKNEVPVVVIDPIKVDDPTEVKEVEILPVMNNKATVITKAKPTVEVVEEIPVDSENAAVVIEPIVK